MLLKAFQARRRPARGCGARKRCPCALIAAAALALAAPSGAGAQERTASIILGDPNEERGLVQVEQPDGRTTPVTVEGRSARATAPGDDPSWGRYIYFQVDDD
ncbi:MAG: hypothetical protein ACRDUY_03165, partial [Nitriliruptorales bacterium]